MNAPATFKDTGAVLRFPLPSLPPTAQDPQHAGHRVEIAGGDVGPAAS